MHHDESPVHMVTTAALRHLSELLGEPVDVRRVRANVVLDVEGSGFAEDAWRGRHLALGDEVLLRLGDDMPRCTMIGMPQPGLSRDGRLLKILAEVHDVALGLQAHVVREGVVRQGDAARLQ